MKDSADKKTRDLWYEGKEDVITLTVKIGERYFRKYSRGRCLTAWSQAGARHFMPMDADRCIAICNAEEIKGKKCKILVNVPYDTIWQNVSNPFGYEKEWNASRE